MADQITTAIKRQFADSYLLMAQQLMSRTEDKVRVEAIDGSVGYIDYLGVGDEPEAQTTLVQATNLTEIPHGRRQVVCAPYNKAVALPEVALKRIIADPSGDYLRLIMAGTKKMIDRRMFAAAIGTSISVSTDLLTTSNISLPSTQKVVESGTLGMIMLKVAQAMTQFGLNDIEDVMDIGDGAAIDKWLFLSPLGIEDLLLDPEVMMSPVNEIALNAVKQGQVKVIFGFNCVMSNRLPKTANIRSNIAWVRGGMALGYNQAYYGVIEKRADLNGISQARGHIDVGFTRLQETHVFELQAYEDPSRAATTPQ